MVEQLERDGATVPAKTRAAVAAWRKSFDGRGRR